MEASIEPTGTSATWMDPQSSKGVARSKAKAFQGGLPGNRADVDADVDVDVTVMFG